MSEVILASGSAIRAQILENAGIAFRQVPAEIDERAVEKPLTESGMDGGDIAMVLAIAKATEVSKRHPGSHVIGSDQTLSLNGELLHKPEDMEAARRRLLALSGKSHELSCAVVIVCDGEVIWQHTAVSTITFRDLDPGFVGRHLAAAGDVVLSSVGAYQIEGLGVQLFDKIEGDFFSIMGLPLLPLLAQMRKLEIME
jgi:septum formation protein